MPARRAVSLSGLGLLLAASLAPRLGLAQAPSQTLNNATPAPQGTLSGSPSSYPAAGNSDYAPEPARVLHFTKPPNSALVPKPAVGSQGKSALVPRSDSGTHKTGRPGSSPAPNGSMLRPATFQAPPRDLPVPPSDEPQVYEVQLEPPGPLRLFRLESEQALQERIRQEVRDRTPPGATPERTLFPEEPVVSRQPYRGRSFPPGNVVVEPSYLCYERLYFEQKNFERYGWDLGPITPLLSAAGFYWDLAWLPYHMGTAPCRQYECSAGYCLPGSPVPLLLYPPELSLTGFVTEAGIVAALAAIF